MSLRMDLRELGCEYIQAWESASNARPVTAITIA